MNERNRQQLDARRPSVAHAPVLAWLLANIEDNMALYASLALVILYVFFAWRSFPLFEEQIRGGELPSVAKRRVQRRVFFGLGGLVVLTVVFYLFDDTIFGWIGN